MLHSPCSNFVQVLLLCKTNLVQSSWFPVSPNTEQLLGVHDDMRLFQYSLSLV